MEDVKKYKKMENVLNRINQKYIALPYHEVRRNNKIVEQVVDKILVAIKNKSPLFKTMFERQFYGGSYYDGIKVGRPVEFDLDFVLKLPVLMKPVLEVGDKPGFVQVHIMEFEKLMNQRDQFSKYDKLETLFDDKRYLSTEKVLCWMEQIVNLALNEIQGSHNRPVEFNVKLSDKENLIMQARIAKCHPAFTLKLTSKDNSIKLDIDLVPCFQFTNDQWPRGKYRSNPFPVQWDKFLVVPKKPKYNCQNIVRYWRLSFQEQERELIKGPQNNTLKPALRLLKKLRDKHNHAIASYHIKTVFLWQVSEVGPEIWRQPISVVFMMMLKKYGEMMTNKCIPYYWNKNYNMIGHLQQTTLSDIGRTLINIIKTIDRYVDEDPFIVAKFLIEPHEIEKLRREPDILGKKVLKRIASMNNSTCQPNVLTFSSETAVFSHYATSALHTALASLSTSATNQFDIAEVLRNIGVGTGNGTIVTSSDEGSTVKSTSETGSGNGSQTSNIGSDEAVGITNNSDNSFADKDRTPKDLDIKIGYCNSLSYSSSQLSDVSNDKVIEGCACTDVGSSNSLSKDIANNVVSESCDADVDSNYTNSLSYSLSQMSDVPSINIIEGCGCTDVLASNSLSKNIVNNVNESSDTSVESNSGVVSIETKKMNILDTRENDDNNIRKSDVINDDGFESGDSNHASCVSDNSDKEVGNGILDKNIYITLEKLNEKIDVMSSVLNKLEYGHEILLKLCSRLSEKVQALEDRIDTMDQDVNANQSISEDHMSDVSCVDKDKDCIDAKLAININGTLEQLNKKTDNIFDTMIILQGSNEKLLTICQPLSEKVQILERKIDVINNNVEPGLNSNLEDFSIFGAPVPSSSLTHDNAVLHPDVFTDGY